MLHALFPNTPLLLPLRSAHSCRRSCSHPRALCVNNTSPILLYVCPFDRLAVMDIPMPPKCRLQGFVWVSVLMLQVATVRRCSWLAGTP